MSATSSNHLIATQLRVKPITSFDRKSNDINVMPPSHHAWNSTSQSLTNSMSMRKPKNKKKYEKSHNSRNKQNIPHKEAQRTSELKRFLYLRISGASLSTTTGAGATFTFTRELRRTSVDASDWLSSVRLMDRAT